MEVRLRQDPDFPRRMRYIDEVRQYRIQLHFIGFPRGLAQAAVRALRQFGRLTYSFLGKARTASAKECGGQLTVAEFKRGTLYHAIKNRLWRAGSRRPLRARSTDSYVA